MKSLKTIEKLLASNAGRVFVRARTASLPYTVRVAGVFQPPNVPLVSTVFLIYTKDETCRFLPIHYDDIVRLRRHLAAQNWNLVDAHEKIRKALVDDVSKVGMKLEPRMVIVTDREISEELHKKMSKDSHTILCNTDKHSIEYQVNREDHHAFFSKKLLWERITSHKSIGSAAWTCDQLDLYQELVECLVREYLSLKQVLTHNEKSRPRSKRFYSKLLQRYVGSPFPPITMNRTIAWQMLSSIKDICSEGPRGELKEDPADWQEAIDKLQGLFVGIDLRPRLNLPYRANSCLGAASMFASMTEMGASALESVTHNSVKHSPDDLRVFLEALDYKKIGHAEELAIRLIDAIFVAHMKLEKRLVEQGSLDVNAITLCNFYLGVASELWRIPAYRHRGGFTDASAKLFNAHKRLWDSASQQIVGTRKMKSATYERFNWNDVIPNQEHLLKTLYDIVGRREAFLFRERFYRKRKWWAQYIWMNRSKESQQKVGIGNIAPEQAKKRSSGADFALVWACVDKKRKYFSEYVGATTNLKRFRGNPNCSISKQLQELLAEEDISGEKDHLQKEFKTASVELALRNVEAKSLVAGFWDALSLFSCESDAVDSDEIRSENHILERLIASCWKTVSPRDYDRVATIAHLGIVPGALLAFAEQKPLSVITLDPVFDVYPLPSPFEKLLVIDDLVHTGFTLYAVNEGLREMTGKRLKCRYLVMAKQMMSSSRGKMENSDNGNNSGYKTDQKPLNYESQIRKCPSILTRFRDVESLSSFSLNGDCGTNCTLGDFIKPQKDITGSVTKQEILRVQDALEQQFDRLKSPPTQEELEKRIKSSTRDYYNRFFKQALLVGDTNLAIDIASYIYWKFIIPKNIDAIIATCRFSLPIGVYITLLSKKFTEKSGRPPLRLMLSRQRGTYIQGLRQYLDDRERRRRNTSADSGNSNGKLATLSITLGARRHEWRINKSIQIMQRVLNYKSDVEIEAVLTVFKWETGISVYKLNLTDDQICSVYPTPILGVLDCFE